MGISNTPQNDADQDHEQAKESVLLLEVALEPLPKVGNLCISPEMMLPRGDDITRNQVVGCKYNNNGNIIEKNNSNPIVDEGLCSWFPWKQDHRINCIHDC